MSCPERWTLCTRVEKRMQDQWLQAESTFAEVFYGLEAISNSTDKVRRKKSQKFNLSPLPVLVNEPVTQDLSGLAEKRQLVEKLHAGKVG